MLQELENIIASTSLKKLRFDIGLSYCPPNTKQWLQECKDTLVIAVEPVRSSFESSALCLREYKGKNNNTLVMMNCAFDNVPEPTTAKINVTAGDPGCSSLFELSEIPYPKDREEIVNVLPFSYVLSKIDWEKFEKVEYLKVDTQGKDLSIMKSAKEFHDKFSLVEIESSTNNDYVNAPTQKEVLEYMGESGFRFIEDCPDSGGIDKMFIYEGVKND